MCDRMVGEGHTKQILHSQNHERHTEDRQSREQVWNVPVIRQNRLTLTYSSFSEVVSLNVCVRHMRTTSARHKGKTKMWDEKLKCFREEGETEINFT